MRRWCNTTFYQPNKWVSIRWKKMGIPWWKWKQKGVWTNIWWQNFKTVQVLFWLTICHVALQLMPTPTVEGYKTCVQQFIVHGLDVTAWQCVCSFGNQNAKPLAAVWLVSVRAPCVQFRPCPHWLQFVSRTQTISQWTALCGWHSVNHIRQFFPLKNDIRVLRLQQF